MNPVVLDFPYISQFWSSKPPILNVVENLAKNLGFFDPCKNGEGPPKTKMRVSKNQLCDIYPQYIFPISICGFLRINITKQKVPIGATVKFSFSRL